MSRGAEELAYPRARIAIASGAAGIEAPLDSQKIADLANQAAFETDPAKRAELYGEYQAAQVEEAVFVPLFQPKQLYALRTSVAGFTFHPVYFLDFYTLSKS